MMETRRVLIDIALIFGLLGAPAHGALNNSTPRAIALGQAYTALARGPEAVFWCPANLGLAENRSFSWQLFGVGATLITENNSFSVKTYNDNFTEGNRNISPRGSSYYLTERTKNKLLSAVDEEGLKVNAAFEPLLALGIPVNGGIAFTMPWDIQAALALGFTAGFEGRIPRDIIELFLFGNEFAVDRVATGKPEGYEIGQWDGSAWAIGSLNWAGARPWMPVRLAPYLSEFAVGATLKFMGGIYGEVIESGGEGLVSRMWGIEMDSYVVAQRASGWGLGVDLGAAGVTRDGRTTFSLSLLNLFDFFAWRINARQDSFFVAATELRVTRLLDPDINTIEDVLDNEDLDGDGKVDFRKRIGEQGFWRSLPAILRLGGAYVVNPRLTVMGAYDQVFTHGFGLSPMPRLAGGLEYRLVPWLPMRFGWSVGGRWGNSSAVGFGLGPYTWSRLELQALDLALVNRGGFFPGVSKGTAISLQLFKLTLL